jgi:murein DD-endopeptidase MepM/ murein hydrolase activator NlpD
MKIYRPVFSNHLNQGWGENKACVKSTNGHALRPFQVLGGIYTTCPIDSIPFYTAIGMKGHNGYDLMTYHGEPVYHSGEYDGWMKTEIDSEGGIGVRVISNDPQIEGKHAQLLYWHLKSVVGYDKKPIKEGDLIGYADNTGSSGGDHLHFALKLCDKYGKTLNSDNGYAGAIDQTPFYENVFVLKVLDVKEQALTAIQLANKVILALKAKLGLI